MDLLRELQEGLAVCKAFGLGKGKADLDKLPASKIDLLRDKSPEADNYWHQHQKVLEQELAREGFDPSTGVPFIKPPRSVRKGKGKSTIETGGHIPRQYKEDKVEYTTLFGRTFEVEEKVYYRPPPKENWAWRKEHLYTEEHEELLQKLLGG